jgi:Asp-tRNA(Asn)/Glu-tRNA(Gln) amidotransferase A subunit family amidase
MARELADCAALLRVLDPAATGHHEPPAERAGARGPLAGIRIGLSDRTERIGTDADTADGLDRAIRACRELGAGIRVRPAAAELDTECYSTILFSEVAAYHQRFAGREACYRSGVREFVEMSRYFRSPEAYRRARGTRTRLAAGWRQWFSDHDVDVLLEPTTPGTAPPRGQGYTAGALGSEGDALIRFTALWSTTGFPVAAIPTGLGRRSGLPVGVSLIAPRGAEQRVIRVGSELQRHALSPPAVAGPTTVSDALPGSGG